MSWRPNGSDGLSLNPKGSSADLQVKEVEAAARTLGREMHVLKATSDTEINSAFSTLEQRKAGALLIAADPYYACAARLACRADRHATEYPTLFHTRDITAAGGLMSYGANIPDSYRQAGIYAGRILKGEKPGDLPVMQAAKFELVINMKTAKALGLEIPDRLMALSDDAIDSYRAPVAASCTRCDCAVLILMSSMFAILCRSRTSAR